MEQYSRITEYKKKDFTGATCFGLPLGNNYPNRRKHNFDPVTLIKEVEIISIGNDIIKQFNLNYLTNEDINKIIEKLYCLGYNGIYYIQNFLQTSTNIGNITQKKILEKDKIRDDLLKIEFRN